MPGEATVQYRRNLALDEGSVAIALVLVLRAESLEPTGEAEKVQAILT